MSPSTLLSCTNPAPLSVAQHPQQFSNLILDIRLNCLGGYSWGRWCYLLATFEVVNGGSHQ